MSQVQDNEQQGQELTLEQQYDQFSEGFDLGDDDGGANANKEHQGGEEEGPEAEEPAKQKEEEKPAPVTHEEPQRQYEAPEPQPVQEEEPEPTKKIDAPDGIKDEIENLRKLNPAAAELALEDSPEGERLRSRLEEFGADLALDRAEHVLDKRTQEQTSRRSEIERQQRAVQEHNNRFMATLQRDHPAYAALITDPAKKAEAVSYQQEIMSWISNKPYAEAAPLMAVAKSGRDPQQVSALLTQFETERAQAQAKKPDPTGALAVPGRGAPNAPSGVGDRDDFDAGWNLNQSK